MQGKKNSVASAFFLILGAAAFAVPSIFFVQPEGEYSRENFAYLNVSVSGTAGIFKLNWNGTNATIYSPELLGAWDFNGNGQDWSPYGNDGLLLDGNASNNDLDSPPVFTSGKYGSGIAFDGYDDYFNISGWMDSASEVTVEAWIFKKSSKNQDILTRKWDGDNYGYKLWVLSNDRLELQLRDITNASGYLRSNAVLSNNTWYHVAGTYNGSEMRLYINGQLDSSKEFLDGLNQIDYVPVIGAKISARSGDMAYVFNGTLDEVRVYSRAKPAEEIGLTYNSELGRHYMNLTSILEGSYSYYAWANDSSGENQTGTRTMSIDRTAPAWVQAAQDQVLEYGDRFYYDLNASDNLGNVQYSVNDTFNFKINPATGVAENNTLLGTGIYALNVSINDSAGNRNSGAFSVTVQDTTLPVVSIQVPQESQKFNVLNVPLNFTVWDLGGVSSCRYELNGVNNSLPNCQDTTMGGIIQGANSVRVWANDSSGNWNASLQVSFSVDTFGPGVSIQSPANATYASASTGLNFTAGDASGISSCRYELDGANYSLTGCANTSLNGLAEGAHKVKVWANDTFSNWNSSLAVSFGVDTIVPSISIQAPSQNQDFSSLGVPLNFTVADSGGVSSCKYELNGFNFSIPNCQNVTMSAIEGSNSVKVWANDSSDNWGVSAQILFNVDTLKPGVSIQSPEDIAYTSRTIPLNFTASDPSGVSACWYSLDNWITNYSLPGCQNASMLAGEGANTLGLAANDTFGNLNYSVSVSFFVDSIAPAWSPAPGSQTIEYGLGFYYDANATDANGIDKYSLNDSANFRIEPATGVIQNNTLLPTGIYLLNVSANDTYGNRNSSIFTVTVQDTILPTVQIQSPVSDNYTTNSLLLNYTVSDLNGISSCKYELNGVNYSLPNCQNLTISAAENGNLLKVWANDSAGNWNYAQVSFTVDTTRPAFSLEQLNETAFNGSRTIKLTFNVSDAYGIDTCWAELALEDGSRTNVSGSRGANTCTVLGEIIQLGDFSLKPYANDTNGNTGNGTEKSGVRVLLEWGQYQQDAAKQTAAGGLAYITQLLKANNTLGDMNANNIPTGVQARGGWSCAEQISTINLPAGAYLEVYANNCSQTNVITKSEEPWASAQATEASQNISRRVNGTNKDNIPFTSVYWSTPNESSSCWGSQQASGYFDITAGNVWAAFANMSGDCISEGVWSEFEVYGTPTESGQNITKSRTVVNNAGVSFPSVQWSTANDTSACWNWQTPISGTYDLAASIVQSVNMSGDCIQEGGWNLVEVKGAPTVTSQTIFTNKTASNQDTDYDFTNVYWNNQVDTNTCWTAGTTTGYYNLTASTAIEANKTGDCIQEENADKWRQDQTHTTTVNGTAYATSNYTIKNLAAHQFNDLDLAKNVTNRTGWSCPEKISGTDLPPDTQLDWAQAINCTKENVIVTIAGGNNDWTQDTGQTTIAGGLAYTKGNIKANNLDTLNYTSVQFPAEIGDQTREGWACTQEERTIAYINPLSNWASTDYPTNCTKNNVITKNEGAWTVVQATEGSQNISKQLNGFNSDQFVAYANVRWDTTNDTTACWKTQQTGGLLNINAGGSWEIYANMSGDCIQEGSWNLVEVKGTPTVTSQTIFTNRTASNLDADYDFTNVYWINQVDTNTCWTSGITFGYYNLTASTAIEANKTGDCIQEENADKWRQDTTHTTSVNGTAYTTSNYTIKNLAAYTFLNLDLTQNITNRTGWSCPEKTSTINLTAGADIYLQQAINCTKEKAIITISGGNNDWAQDTGQTTIAGGLAYTKGNVKANNLDTLNYTSVQFPAEIGDQTRDEWTCTQAGRIIPYIGPNAQWASTDYPTNCTKNNVITKNEGAWTVVQATEGSQNISKQLNGINFDIQVAFANVRWDTTNDTTACWKTQQTEGLLSINANSPWAINANMSGDCIQEGSWNSVEVKGAPTVTSQTIFTNRTASNLDADYDFTNVYWINQVDTNPCWTSGITFGYYNLTASTAIEANKTGDCIQEENADKWRQDTTHTTTVNGTAYTTSNYTIKNLAAYTFNNLDLTQNITNRTGWSCPEKMSGTDLPPGTQVDWAQAINCTKEKAITKALAHKKHYNSSVIVGELLYAFYNFTVENSDSLSYANVFANYSENIDHTEWRNTSTEEEFFNIQGGGKTSRLVNVSNVTVIEQWGGCGITQYGSNRKHNCTGNLSALESELTGGLPVLYKIQVSRLQGWELREQAATENRIDGTSIGIARAEGSLEVNLTVGTSHLGAYSLPLGIHPVEFVFYTYPPAPVFQPPTYANGSMINVNYTFVNVSTNQYLVSCLLEWNETNNISAAVEGMGCHLNRTDVPDGWYSYRMWANNTVGNWNRTETRTILIDTTPPIVNISYPGGWRNAFNLSKNESDQESGIVECRLEYRNSTVSPESFGNWIVAVGYPAPCPADATFVSYLNSYVATHNRSYQFRYSAKNGAGSWGYANITNVTKLDLTPPDISLDYADGWINDTLNIALTKSQRDDESGVAECRLQYKNLTVFNNTIQGDFNSIQWANVSSPDDCAYTSFPGVNGRAYRFRYAARNNVGNWSAWAEPGKTAKIDITPPEFVNVSYPDKWHNDIEDYTFPLLLWGNDSQSGIADCELQYRNATMYNGAVKDGYWEGWRTVPKDKGNCVSSFTGTNGGAYRFRYRLKNYAGLWNDFSENANVSRIDITPPSVMITYKSGWQTVTAISIATTEYDNESGIAEYDVDFRQKQASNGLPDFSGVAWSGFSTAPPPYAHTGADGWAYQFRYRTKNNANLWSNFDYQGSETSPSSLGIDTTPPAAGLSYPDGWQSTGSTAISVINNDPQSGIASCELYYQNSTLDHGSPSGIWSGWTENPNDDCDRTVFYIPLGGDGQAYRLKFNVTNNAGGTNETVGTNIIYVDMTAPDMSSLGVSYPNGWWTSTNVPITTRGDDLQSGILECDLEYNRSQLTQGNPGAWGVWTNVGSDWGDCPSAPPTRAIGTKTHALNNGYAYKFRFRVKNTAGTPSEDYVYGTNVTWIDESAPAATFDYASGWRNTLPMGFTSKSQDDPQSGVAACHFSFKNVTLAGGAPTAGWDAELSWIQSTSDDCPVSSISTLNGVSIDGQGLKLRYNITNNAGLTSEINPNKEVWIDATAPGIDLFSYTNGWQTTTTIDNSVINHTQSDPQSGVQDCDLEYKDTTVSNGIVNNAGWSGWNEVNGNGGDCGAISPALTGSNGYAYKFKYTVTNKAGLSSTSEPASVLKIDTTAPVGLSFSYYIECPTPCWGDWTTENHIHLSRGGSDPESGIDCDLQYKHASATADENDDALNPYGGWQSAGGAAWGDCFNVFTPPTPPPHPVMVPVPCPWESCPDGWFVAPNGWICCNNELSEGFTCWIGIDLEEWPPICYDTSYTTSAGGYMLKYTIRNGAGLSGGSYVEPGNEVKLEFTPPVVGLAYPTWMNESTIITFLPATEYDPESGKAPDPNGCVFSYKSAPLSGTYGNPTAWSASWTVQYTTCSFISFPGSNWYAYKFNYTVTNKAGLFTNPVWTTWVGIDTTSPDYAPGISYPSGWKTDTNVISFSWEGDDTQSGIGECDLEYINATVRDKDLGPGPWESLWKYAGGCNPAVGTFTYNALNGQAYQFKFRIKNKASLWSVYTAAGPEIDIDALPPVVTFSYRTGWINTSGEAASFNISHTEEDNESGLQECILNYKKAILNMWDGNANFNAVSWTTIPITCGFASPYAFGLDDKYAYKFNYTVRNKNYNKVNTETSIELEAVKVDTTNATGTSVSYPDGWWNTSSIPITRAGGDQESGLADYDLEFKEAPISFGVLGDWNESGRWYEAGGTDGNDNVNSFSAVNRHAYQFRYRVKNGASLWIEYVYNPNVTKVDTQKPVTTATIDTIVIPPGTTTGWYRAAKDLFLTGEDPESTVNRTYYKIDGGSYGVYATTPINVSEDLHAYTFYSTDWAGWTEDAKTITIRKDTTPPSMTKVRFRPDSVEIGSGVHILVTANITDFAGVEYANVCKTSSGCQGTPANIWCSMGRAGDMWSCEIFTGSLPIGNYPFYVIAKDINDWNTTSGMKMFKVRQTQVVINGSSRNPIDVQSTGTIIVFYREFNGTAVAHIPAATCKLKGDFGEQQMADTGGYYAKLVKPTKVGWNYYNVTCSKENYARITESNQKTPGKDLQINPYAQLGTENYIYTTVTRLGPEVSDTELTDDDITIGSYTLTSTEGYFATGNMMWDGGLNKWYALINDYGNFTATLHFADNQGIENTSVLKVATSGALTLATDAPDSINIDLGSTYIVRVYVGNKGVRTRNYNLTLSGGLSIISVDGARLSGKTATLPETISNKTVKTHYIELTGNRITQKPQELFISITNTQNIKDSRNTTINYQITNKPVYGVRVVPDLDIASLFILLLSGLFYAGRISTLKPRN